MFLAPLIAGIAMLETGLGVPFGLFVALTSGVAMGAINAFFIVRLRVIPFIVTLATLFLFRGFGTWLTSSQQFDFADDMRAFGLGGFAGIPTPILFFAGVAVLIHILLAHTPFGRQIYALGNDREAARKAGLRMAWIEARVYILCLACASLSGFIIIAPIRRLLAPF